MNCFRVHFQAAWDHHFQGDQSPVVKFTPAVSNCIQTKPKTRLVETTDVTFESHFRFVFPAFPKSKQPSKKMGEMIQETTSQLLYYWFAIQWYHGARWPESSSTSLFFLCPLRMWKDWWNNELIRCLGSALISSSLEKACQHGKTNSGGCSHTVSMPENN